MPYVGILLWIKRWTSGLPLWASVSVAKEAITVPNAQCCVRIGTIHHTQNVPRQWVLIQSQQ